MFVALAVVGAIAPARTASAQEREQLEELRERIEESRGKVEQHEAEERALFDRLDAIDQRLASLGVSARAARADARRARAARDEIVRETERLAGVLARTRAAMRTRAVALYKAGDVGPLRVLFSADSLRELMQRVTVLERLLEHDGALVARYERDAVAYTAARADADRATARHEAAAAKLASEERALAGERGAKRELLARVRSDRRRERALLVELEKSARALEVKLAEIGESGRRDAAWVDGSGFAAARGALPLPVDARVTGRFGRVTDAEFHTQTVRNGVEFAAEEGELVRATARGVVRFAGWFRGYGRIVILDHGDSYFTVNGHLSEIDVAVGDRVEAEGAIGRAGDTGSLTGAKLYFELRQGKDAIDPLPWFAPERLAAAR
ncbi:MAG: M23 family metallopeptidase [Myxococcota bacterium]